MTEKENGLNKPAAATGGGREVIGDLKDTPLTEQKNPESAAGDNQRAATDNKPASKTTGSNSPRADKKSNAAKKRRSKKTPENTECQNCGATLQGDYCHQCGQAAKEPRRLVIGLVQDVFVETLAIDGKLARSITLLFWRPGLLARRFLEGKRMRYSPPFRLYLFASVFFFFAAFWMFDAPETLIGEGGAPADPEAIAAAQEEIIKAKKEVAAALGDAAPEVVDGAFDALDATLAETQSETPEDAAPIDGPTPEAGAAADADIGDVSKEEDADEEQTGMTLETFRESTWADANYTGPAGLEPHVKRFYEASQRVVADPRLFFSEMRANVPRFLLLAPVIYGLTLTFLYFYRRKFFIYDHFIVSLYMHAALYAYLLLALLINRIPVVGSWLWIAPIVWGALQPMLVLRQAYGSNWFSVWIKWFISIGIYFIALIAIIMLGLSYSLYQS